MSLYDQLTDRIQAELPEVQLVLDKHKEANYVIVKSRGRTVGYVSGVKRLTVHLPRTKDGQRTTFAVRSEMQIPHAVELLTAFVPEEVAT